MSTRTYQLRARTDVGPATQPQARSRAVPPPRSSVLPTQDASPHLTGSNPVTDATTSLYSDVVTESPPSPMKENQASLLSGSIDTDVMDTPNLLPDETQTLVIHQNNNNKIVKTAHGL